MILLLLAACIQMDVACTEYRVDMIEFNDCTINERPFSQVVIWNNGRKWWFRRAGCHVRRVNKTFVVVSDQKRIRWVFRTDEFIHTKTEFDSAIGAPMFLGVLK